MTDRVIVYPGALPQDTDILNTNLFAMINGGFKNQALLGSSTVVAGLACTPTGPASLQVNINTGSIFKLDPIDASAYGSAGANNNNILKQGILQIAQTLAITPPGTTGFSQVFLVQATLNDTDEVAEVLSYFNSANITQPFSGPANSGTSQFTIRRCKCVVALKAGVPATTGTQTTPSPDAGFVGLFAITVANGATQVTSGNIVQLASAPFFPPVPQIPFDVQQQNYTFAGTDTGAANAYVITFAAGKPQPAAYTTGMKVSFKALNANTAASTINVNGLGTVAIRRATGVALSAADINSGQVVDLTYDGTNFQMANYLGAGATSNTSTIIDIPYAADSGAQNAIVATFSPSIGAYTDGLYVAVKLAFAITGACTINANGLGLKSVVLGDGTNPPFNVFPAGMDLLLVYSTVLGKFQIANTSASMFYVRPTSNYTIFVNTSTGNDSTLDGTSATVGSGTAGPFKTIGRAIQAAWGYAPSQFTITIQVAAGTYNEAAATPSFAGPNVIINGVSAASVTISSGTSHAIVVTGPNTLTVQNVTVQTSGGLAGGFGASAGASLVTNNTASNGVSGAVFFSGAGGTLKVGNHTFSGSSTYLYWSVGGNIGLDSAPTHTFSTPISVTASVASLFSGIVGCQSTNSPVIYVNPTFVSGSKFDAEFNGVIDADLLGVNFYPGNAAGTTSTGGQYRP